MPLTLLAGVFFFLLSLFAASARAEELDIQFKVSPPPERVRPFADAATLSVRVAKSDGRAIEQGWIDVRLTAPKPGRFFSTDFPIVEGTELAELRLPLRQGRAEWKYLFPIRGNYGVSIQAVAPDGSIAGRNFAITVRENEQKWFMLGAFVCALFALGVIAGRIFTVATAKRTARVIVLAMLCGAGMSFCAAEAQAQDRRHDGAGLEVEPATVGKMSRIRWSVAGQPDGTQPVARLTLTITHLESRKTAFAVERVLVPGEFSLQFQFTDGAEYRVAALAELPGGTSVRSEKLVSVTAVEPPAKAMVPALGFFLGVIAAGLAAGRLSKRAKRVEAPSAAG